MHARYTRALPGAKRKYGSAFTDVKLGSNNFGEANATACALGYAAAAGWDAASGLGVPRIDVLAKAAVKYAKLQRRRR